MAKLKKILSAAARGSLRIISATIIMPMFLVAVTCEFIDPILEEVERKMGWYD